MAVRRAQIPRTAEAVVAAELRGLIVRGELKPGEKIRQEATAEQLGISLIPVREALKTLATEGIVTYQPQRGYFVTELRAAAVGDIYVVRDLLETQAESEALARLSSADLEAMARHLRDQGRAVQERDAVEMIDANRRFHFAVFERCENPWLIRFVTHLWDTLDPYRVLSYQRLWLQDVDGHVPAEILGEHERILSALQAGKHDAALRLLAWHRSRSETFLRTLIELSEPPAQP
jgi:DNA-binding GntR family transcriptional regulator